MVIKWFVFASTATPPPRCIDSYASTWDLGASHLRVGYGMHHGCITRLHMRETRYVHSTTIIKINWNLYFHPCRTHTIGHTLALTHTTKRFHYMLANNGVNSTQPLCIYYSLRLLMRWCSLFGQRLRQFTTKMPHQISISSQKRIVDGLVG